MAINLDTMTIPEIFQHVSELPASKRGHALRQIGNLMPEVKQLLKLTFHKKIKLELPEGTPPYKEMEVPKNMGLNRLPREMRKFQYFLPETNMNNIRREKIFIDLLEGLSPDEAKLVIMVKDKKLTGYKGITRKVVEEAMPEIFDGENNV